MMGLRYRRGEMGWAAISVVFLAGVVAWVARESAAAPGPDVESTAISRTAISRTAISRTAISRTAADAVPPGADMAAGAKNADGGGPQTDGGDGPAAAGVPRPVLHRVQVGFEGTYRSGFWAAVRVELQGGSHAFQGTLTVTTLDGDGHPVRHVWGEGEPLSLPARQRVTLERCVKFGRPAPRLVVELSGTCGTEPLQMRDEAELLPPLRSDRELILSVGRNSVVDEATLRRPRGGELPPAVRTVEASQLPESWLGYEPVNSVVVTTSDLEQLAQVSDRQLDALRQWVALGGRLVLCAGSRGAELFGDGGRWSMFLPGPFQQVAALRNTSSLESFTGSSKRLEVGPEGMPLTALGKVTGKVDLTAATPGGLRPLIVRSPSGLGQVVFAALDLDQPPLSRWEGRGRLVQRLLRDSADGADRTQEGATSGPLVQFGYHDIAGQLRSALDQFPGVTLVAFSWVAGLLLLYLLLIGPADYFLLRDVVGRMHWTWLTFPLLVAGFAALTVVLNTRFRSDTLRVNQLDLVDVDQASGVVRGTAWVHIYSPQPAVHSIDLKREAVVRGRPLGSGGQIVAWQGLPGVALGGLDATTSSPGAGLGACQIRFASEQVSSMVDVPFPVASTRSLLGRWWEQREPVAASHAVPKGGPESATPPQSSLRRDPDGLLRGELWNPLPHELTDCMVYYENWVYRLDSRRGVLAPGERTRIDVERALNLQWRLSGRRVIDSKDVSTAWDQNTLEVPRILEMMMFHGAVGGETYTQLLNRYQGYVDLSEHLWLGRAMLVGRSRSPATAWSVDGQAAPGDERRTTVFRVIFPVELPGD